MPDECTSFTSVLCIYVNEPIDSNNNAELLF